jgi:hypothetical protein
VRHRAGRRKNRGEGWNRASDGEEFFFIPTPPAGLWATREKLYNRATGFAR